MRSAVLHDSEFIMEERPDPTPGHGDVLVHVVAAGINAADLLQRRGVYPAPPGWPSDVPGLEFAGRVVALGDGVSAEWMGQRVCGIVGGGAHASHLVVPAEHLIPVPPSATWDEAAGFAEAALTAFDALIRQADLTEDERVIVSGATGGVGNMAIQIARLFRADVTALVRNLDHAKQLRRLGARSVITVEEVADLTPVDVILELVGRAHFEHLQHRLANFARVVIIGVGSGAQIQFDLRTLMATRSSIMGSTLRGRSRDEKALLTQDVIATLGGPWSNGDLTVPIHRTFDFGDIAAAYDYFAQPGKFGKIILRMSER